MADPNLIPFNHTGIFTIGTGAAGAPSIQAMLSVPANSSIVNGYGELKQAVHPPIASHNSFHGVVHVLVFGGAVTQVYALHGTPIPPGVSLPYVPQLVIDLNGIWGTEGKATFTYVDWQHHVHEVKDAPVKVQWLLQA